MLQTDSSTDLERRLSRLETSLRRYRRSAIAMAGILFGSSLLFAQGRVEHLLIEGLPASPQAMAALLVQDSITVVDSAGEERATITTTVDGAALVLFDADGRPRAGIDAGYTPSLVLYDEEGRTRVVLGATSAVASHVESSDGLIERRPVSSLVLFKDDGSVLERLP